MRVTEAWLDSIQMQTLGLVELLHAYLPSDRWEDAILDQRSVPIPDKRNLVDSTSLLSFRDEHARLLNPDYNNEDRRDSFSDALMKLTPLSYPFMVELGLAPGIRWFGGRIDKLRKMMELLMNYEDEKRKNEPLGWVELQIRTMMSSIRTILCEFTLDKNNEGLVLKVLKHWRANADEEAPLPSKAAMFPFKFQYVALTFPYDVGSRSLSSLELDDAQFVGLGAE